MNIDAVVTDIDGVLVDTSDSYHRAIVESVRTVYGKTIERKKTQAFKDAGGFNNDWVTTDAVALFILASRHGYAGDIDRFTDAIADRGGSLEGAKAVLADALPAQTYEEILDAWDPTELRRTFQWLYLGPERYEALEDDNPPRQTPDCAGFMDDEPIIIADDTRAFLESAADLGVLTGRPRAEAEIALDRVDLDPAPERVIAMEDWEGGKPDPAGLVRLGADCSAQQILYIGDELDDVRTAVNADAADPERTYHGIGVLTGGLSGESGAEAFSTAGATAVLESINELPAFLETD